MPDSIRRFTAPLVLLLCALSYADPSQADVVTPTAPELRATLQRHLFDAARTGHLPMLQEFITAAYPLNTRDEKGYTALILAAYHGHAEAVNLLLAAGADACAEDHRGNTALMGAIFKGELAVARTLLNTDCNPDQRNAAGQTPAMYAALFGRLELLNALKAKGADLQLRDIDGNNAESLARGEIRTAAPRYR